MILSWHLCCPHILYCNWPHVCTQVPDLAGFWLLTLLLQLPLTLFLLLNEATIITPLERAMHILLTIFVVLEVVIGYFAIRAMVNYQVTKFHLQQFTDMERIQDPGHSMYQNDMYENRYTQWLEQCSLHKAAPLLVLNTLHMVIISICPTANAQVKEPEWEALTKRICKVLYYLEL